MTKYKAVSIPNGAFIFCRYGLAIMLWLAYFFRAEWVLLLVLIIFALSAALTVAKAPMILLYSYTVEKIKSSRQVIVNSYAIRFAHILATAFALVCVLLLHIGPNIGWRAVLVFAVIKSVSALGFCPASRLYECANGSSCCTFMKKHD